MSIATASMAEAFAGIRTSRDFSFMLRDFLDRFREHPSAELLQEEPAPLIEALADDGLADAWLASVAAWLSRHHRLPVPGWAQGTARILSKPWFAAESHNLRVLLLQDSPSEFRIRNLFVSADALNRA